MSIPFLPIHPHPHPQRLMSKTNRRRLRRQQAGVQAPQGGPDFVSPEDQFRMSLDTVKRQWSTQMRDTRGLRSGPICRAKASASALPCAQESVAPNQIHPRDIWMT